MSTNEARRAIQPTAPIGFATAILLGLTAKGSHVYGGTVYGPALAERRNRARAARKARRLNRK